MAVSPVSQEMWARMPSGEAAERIQEAFSSIWFRARPGEKHVYPPPLFDAEFGRALSSVSTDLVNLLTEMPQRVFGNNIEAWLDYLGVSTAERPLLSAAYKNPHLRRAATAFTRPDILLSDTGMKTVEINVGAPIGGITGHDPYVRAFRASQLNDLVLRLGYRVDVPEMVPLWLDAFTSVLRCSSARPHVFEAIADPTDPNLGRYFFAEMLENAGFDVSYGLVTDLELTADGAAYGGRRIDVVFAMYTWQETCQFVPSSVTRQLTELDSRGLIDFIGSPTSTLYENKINLELFTSPRYRHLLGDAERALVDKYVPATFRLTAETYREAAANKDSLVCKPSSAYSGKGIVCGWTVDAGEWRNTLESRLREQQAYVCQRRVVSTVAYDSPTSGEPIEICFGPLVLGGRYAGTFTRELPKQARSVINNSVGSLPGALLAVTHRGDHESISLRQE